MNQDQIKHLLLQIEPDIEEFSVILSGKKSTRVNGLYKPDSREIIIHNQNFTDDNLMVYTAIHEFAHHIHYSRGRRPVGMRAHTIEFRAIFHNLLQKAERAGLYRPVPSQHPELEQLAADLRRRFIVGHGNLMVEFGRELVKAEQLCKQHNARFEDFLERVLGVSKHEAGELMRLSTLNLPADLGVPTMKTLARVRDADQRSTFVGLATAGASPDMIKHAVREQAGPATVTAAAPTIDPGSVRAALEKAKLERERERIVRELQRLQERLQTVEQELAGFDGTAAAVAPTATADRATAGWSGPGAQ